MRLSCGQTEVELALERGGGLSRFVWRGRDVFRPARPGSPFELACFPLVPFSNRIANGRFAWGGHEYSVAPNIPGGGHPHPLHGFGWLSRWTLVDATSHRATLAHEHAAADWPGAYAAEQTLTLTDTGYTHRLSIANVGDAPLPAGLGLHPYLPRRDARLSARFSDRWITTPDGLPLDVVPLADEPDWFGDPPIDTVFSGRSGTIVVDWPGMRLTVLPGAALGHTVIFAPAGADFFCVEPVSHRTDAINGAPAEMRTLAPGERWSVEVRFTVEATG